MRCLSGYGDPRPGAGGQRTAADYASTGGGRADPRHGGTGMHRAPATLPTR